MPPPPITVATDIPPVSSSHDGAASPTRPPVSPITPPPGVARQTFTHTSQTDQVAVPPPAPEPIDFESNPDAIALKSAIAILQIQKNRAAADIQTLSKVREEALGNQDAFVKDLVAGKVKTTQEGTLSRPLDDTHDDDNNDDDDDDENDHAGTSAGTKGEGERIWAQLPPPQNVVRCPPINWSQYAVVGESLDKLHSEQVRQPPRGVPATLGADGTYQFAAGSTPQEPYRGVAAPYDPAKDKVDRKKKNTKR